MTLTKHNYKNFNDLFEDFFRPTVLGKEAGLATPPVNIHETNEAYHLELFAPGLNKEDFKVNLEKGRRLPSTSPVPRSSW